MKEAVTQKEAAQGGEPSAKPKFSDYPANVQWDIVMQRAMAEKIVGKRGFKKMYKGKIRAVNIEYFSDALLNEVQRVAAQGIRGFRATLEKAINGDIDKLNAQLKEEHMLLQVLPWWRWKRREDTAGLIRTITTQIDVLKTALRHCKETVPYMTPAEKLRVENGKV